MIFWRKRAYCLPICCTKTIHKDLSYSNIHYIETESWIKWPNHLYFSKFSTFFQLKKYTLYNHRFYVPITGYPPYGGFPENVHSVCYPPFISREDARNSVSENPPRVDFCGLFRISTPNYPPYFRNFGIICVIHPIFSMSREDTRTSVSEHAPKVD